MHVQPKIVILGGYGVFGSYISSELAKWTNHDLVIAGRNLEKGRAFAQGLGVQFSVCNINNQKSLYKTIDNAFIVINPTGPFTSVSYVVAQASLKVGAHYIDISDGRNMLSTFQV